MPLEKLRKDLRVAILVPCYKRPEYTVQCLKALKEAQVYDKADFFLVDDGSNDDTAILLQEFAGDNVYLKINEVNVGLRQTIIEFFRETREEYDILAKVDNDCLVPKNWLNDMLTIFENSPADILSPAVFPSEAELRYGKNDKEGHGYLPAKTIGGLWIMKSSMVKGIDFEEHSIRGIKGAIPVLWQIQSEKEPNMGWVQDIVYQDIGHWSGKHPDNIKSVEHENYYREVGRRVAWESKEAVCQ